MGTLEGATILVIDDDPAVCDLLTILFQQHHAHVETATSGQDGVNKVRALNPDLVLLDVMMPMLDGWETCQLIKQEFELPVMFISAKTDSASIAHGLGLGAIDYISKPFIPKDLIRRISVLLSWITRSEKACEQSDQDFPCVPGFLSGHTVIPRRIFSFIKAAIDFIGGIAGCLLFLLILVPVSVLIKFDSQGPILFSQIRVGKDGKPFRIHKFRTMNHTAPAYGQNGSDDTSRLVTRVGRVLRRTGLDEFPQFLNVIRGEMSLVGPRPELPNVVATYTPNEKVRLSVKPGITGWWQINGRRQPMRNYSQIDLDYVDHQSLAFDLYIIFRTLLKAIRHLLFC